MPSDFCLPSPLFRGFPTCARSTPKIRPSSIDLGPLHHVLALALVVGSRPSLFPSRIHRPASLRSTLITRFLATMETLTSPRVQSHEEISPIHVTQTSDRSVSNHPRVHPGRFLLTLVPSAPDLFPSDRFPSASTGSWASPFTRRLAEPQRPNRVPLVRTGRSPPVALHPASRRRSYFRLSMSERLMEDDFHLSVCVRSRAHERPRLAGRTVGVSPAEH